MFALGFVASEERTWVVSGSVLVVSVLVASVLGVSVLAVSRFVFVSARSWKPSSV